jgi:Fic family protein
MQRGLQGHFVTLSTAGEEVQAFVPAPLPPSPPIDWAPTLRRKFDHALLALGRLDSVAALLPETALFRDLYVRKEAVLACMIDGHRSSLADLLIFELGQTPSVHRDDVAAVRAYVAAFDHGVRLLGQGLPLSLRLFREIHDVLLAHERDPAPGEFRRSTQRVSGARPAHAAFVPPPAEAVLACLGNLTAYLQAKPAPAPLLLKAALTHAQLDTIHPFPEGNGRFGCLLLTLLLAQEKVLREPMLCLSRHFKTHRRRYYELLNDVRLTGNWEAWLDFFAEAVIATAAQAVESARELLDLSRRDRERISRRGRAAASTLEVHRALMEQPIATSNGLVEKTGLTPATVNKALGHLEELAIVQELTAQKRNRVFSYAGYMESMNRGTEPPER